MSEGNGQNIPRGWAAAKLADLVEPRTGKAHPQATPRAKFIGMEQVEAHTMRLLGTVPAGSMKSAANSFRPGDVLYGRMRSYLNKVYQPEFPGLCSGEFIVLPETCAVLGRFLKYRLNAGDFVRFASRINAGDRPRVDFDQIKAFDLLLPPRPEQERIADSLEELLSDLDAGVVALERVQKKLAHYRAAVLKAAVEGALTADWRKKHRKVEPASVLLNRILAERRRRWEQDQLRKFKDAGKEPPKGWKAKYKKPKKPELVDVWEIPATWTWTGFAQLADGMPHALKAGPFGSSLKKEYYTPTGYKIYGQEQVIRGDAYFGDYFIDEQRFEQLRSCAVKPGDVLISLVGTTGKVLVLPEDILPGIINPRLLKVSLLPGNVDPHFVKLVLQSPQARHFFKGQAHGGTMEILNLTILKRFPIPFPPLEEQQVIVEEVEDQFSIIEHIETDMEAKLKSAQSLRQSILRHAFTGQLVPQDPNDEPASELLKRIATEREERARQALAARRVKLEAKSSRKKRVRTVRKSLK